MEIFFPPSYPARVALHVARLPKDARVEIEATAVKKILELKNPYKKKIRILIGGLDVL